MFNQNQEQNKINESKLYEFAERVMEDLAATLSSVMVNVGDRLDCTRLWLMRTNPWTPMNCQE